MKSNLMNIDYLVSNVCTVKINYLIDLDKIINVNKEGKFYYYNMFQINKDNIKNFIFNLDISKLYTVIPLISINRNIDRPYITLSRQILISHNSNHFLIDKFLNEKLNCFYEEIGINNFDENKFYLIFKYKSVELNYRTYKTF